MSIRLARSGSAARRWRRARSISPSADKGFIILGKSLTDWKEFLLLFFVVVVVMEEVMVSLKTVTALDELLSPERRAGGLSSEAGDESFLIFCGRIGILEGFDGFFERSEEGDSVAGSG